MTIFVFGNPDLPQDSLPLRLLPGLKARFPKIDFITKDPQEEWEVQGEIVILDTVQGIKHVKVFTGLDAFQPPPHVSLHDFDLYSSLKYLIKLGKLKGVKIIGLPPTMSETEALKKIVQCLEV